jgi:glycosyltransferase involved in cell wall biosynthesis
MIVALDAAPLTLSSGGLLRYTSELSRALAENFPEDEYWLVSNQAFPMPPSTSANLRKGGGPRHWLERRWWLWGLNRELRRRRTELFHGTNFAVPYVPRRPSVLTLHDLSPWMDPGWHHGAGRVRRRTPLLLRLGLATMVLTDSEAVRRQAIERFGLEPSRVAAVPLAAASHFRPIEVRAATPYFLYVGTLEPRKNIPLLIEAWREVRRQYPVELVLAGRRRADFPPLAVEAGLKLKGEVPDEELPTLYSGAVACLYPSLYEGFGLPVLEAMQCGAAVVASRDPAITEVAAGAAVQLDAREIRAWVETLTAALTRPEWLAEWRRKALTRARDFSWARTARLTRDVYDEARRLAAHA